MRDGRALLLHDQKSNETGCEQTWNERDSKQAWVVVIKDSQQPQCGGGTDNRAERVQHPLEAKGASVCLARDSSCEQRLTHGSPHATSEPCRGTRQQNMPRCCGQSDRRRAKCGDDVTEHGDGFAARQFVGVVARSHFGEARQAVAHAFDQAKPRCRDAHRSEECRHERRGNFMGPIGEQACQPDAKHSAIQPPNVCLALVTFGSGGRRCHGGRRTGDYIGGYSGNIFGLFSVRIPVLRGLPQPPTSYCRSLQQLPSVGVERRSVSAYGF